MRGWPSTPRSDVATYRD